jgi:hypothetical protein
MAKIKTLPVNSSGKPVFDPSEFLPKKPSQNAQDTTYSEALDHAAGDDPFAQLLASFGFEQTKGLSGSQRDDLNKQLLDTIIQYYLTQENRDYNELMLQNQRQYDSPMSQLLRLMSTGMSRDAALQAIAGGSSSGSGSTPYSDPSQLGAGIAASQSKLNQVQAATSIANTVFNGVNCLAGLVGLGFSIPQAVQQTKVLENEAYMTGKQKQAYDAASGAHDVVIAAGVENAADVFGSVSSTINTIKELADGGDVAAQEYIGNGGLKALRANSLYASQFLSDMYKSERSAKDYDKYYWENMNLMHTQAALNSINTDKLSAEIPLINAQIEKVFAEEEFIRGQKALLAYTQKEIESRTELNKQQKLFVEEQTQSLDLQNRIESTFLSSSYDGTTGMELINNTRAIEMFHKLERLKYYRQNGGFEKEAEAMLSEQNYLITNYALKYLYDSNALTYMENNSQSMNSWFAYCRAAQECGLFEYIDTMVKQATAGQWRVGPLGGSSAVGVSGVPTNPSDIDVRPDYLPEWYKAIYR